MNSRRLLSRAMGALLMGVLSLGLCSHALASTILVDYDDGDPNNGIHDASIANGGLEDTDTTSGVGLLHRGESPDPNGDIPGYYYSWFQDTPSGGNSIDGPYLWDTGGQDPGDGSNNRTAVSGWQGINNLPRRQLGILVPTTAWSIADGDQFHFEFSGKEGFGMDDDDYVDVEIYAVDYSDPNNLSYSQIGGDLLRLDTPDDGSWALFSHDLTIDYGSMGDLTGQGIAYRFFLNRDGTDALRNEYAILDNFYLTATVIPEPASGLLLASALLIVTRSRRRLA